MDHHKFELSPLFMGILGILSGAAIVATFHCIAIGWCSSHQPPPPPTPPQNRPRIARGSTTTSTQDDSTSTTSNSAAQLITIYIPTNEAKEAPLCAVCLGEYAEEEELRVLPECGHSFHVTCIDTWLHSHPNCPLCRAGAVVPALPPQNIVTSPPHHVVVLPPPPLLQNGGVFARF
ncbi:hypothetical protein HYC85_021995 [Camellia sinensis]|uniref:RING-type E3 ubiquitin transferase n=1 Tax=Camellia sinensis TaxID=4442 RepID=A0A7J7GN47_CAMSI|nr:hypothetical protein HYC85_021995 [Camellia sinensis]